MRHPVLSVASRHLNSLLRVDSLEPREAAASLSLDWEWTATEPSNSPALVSGFETAPVSSDPPITSSVETVTSDVTNPTPDETGSPEVVTLRTTDSAKGEIRVGRGGGMHRLSGGPSNQAPVITSFVHVMQNGNTAVFTGQVNDETPGGLTIRFGGLPSLQGKTTTTDSTGAFTHTVVLQTNGSDTGMAEAQTTDPQGFDSNIASRFVNP